MLGRSWPAAGAQGLAAPVLLLAVLAALVAALDLWWVARDVAPMPHPFDPYAYLARSFRFLEAPDLSRVPELALHGRPPLYQLLSLPGLAIFGRSLDAALLLNVVSKLALLGCTGAMAWLLGGARAGLLAALLVVAYPPVVHLSHVYRPHAALPTCVAASSLFLLLLVRRPSPPLAWAAGASLSFGLLIHPSFALVMGLPALAAGLHLALFRSPPRIPETPARSIAWLLAKLRDPFVTRGLVVAALLALLPAAVWYLSHGDALLEKARFVGARDKIIHLGFPRRGGLLFWYVRTAPAAVSNVLTAFAALGVIQCLRRPSVPRLLLVFALVAGLFSLNLQPARAWWYGAMLLPLAACVTAVGVSELRPARLGQAAALVCAGVAVFLLAFLHLGDAPWSRPVARALGSPLGKDACATLRNAFFCPAPPQPEPWPFTKMMATAEHHSQCGSGRPCTVFLAGKTQYRPFGDGWPTLSTGLFDFHSVQAVPEASFVFLISAAKQCGVEQMLQSDLVVWFEPDARERLGCFGAWSAFLDGPPSPFARSHATLGSFPVPGGRRARLTARTAPLTREEREAVLEGTARAATEANRARREVIRESQEILPARQEIAPQVARTTDGRSARADRPSSMVWAGLRSVHLLGPGHAPAARGHGALGEEHALPFVTLAGGVELAVLAVLVGLGGHGNVLERRDGRLHGLHFRHQLGLRAAGPEHGTRDRQRRRRRETGLQKLPPVQGVSRFFAHESVFLSLGCRRFLHPRPVRRRKSPGGDPLDARTIARIQPFTKSRKR